MEGTVGTDDGSLFVLSLNHVVPDKLKTQRHFKKKKRTLLTLN